MKLKDLETIYYIFDSQDSGYNGWYGTQDDIIEYLEEQLKPFVKEGSWIDGIEKLGLTYKILN